MALPFRATLAAVLPLVISFAVVLGVNLLPPDTALEEIRALGRLTVCAPRDMEPLVINDRERPGFEIELIEEAARRSGWRLAVTSSIAMGREFNPGNWRITRATCRIMVGGLRNNAWSQSLMEMGEPYLASSWIWAAEPGTAWPPETAAFSPGVVALDRVELSTYLRGLGVQIFPVKDTDELLATINAGSGAAGITDSVTATAFSDDLDLAISILPEGPPQSGISIGFWKGDTTLRLHMDIVIEEMRSDGTVARIAEKYGLIGSLIP
ncbi:substrate-binding periplasmic protein [Pelagibacterium luteolum]|uniref:Cystine transport system substrate-binding protein n=1 Tax=Pelagibacterium luteolum TaxID=440168 RepID=A0A1G7Y048_9HYPH|nr:transporter substrate-binding domain-containing protein [Pelagibacterium luteolum]SDG89340.1 cystine transport system substrate-binding protein [Pelagibacterium luteolum]